MSEAEAQGEPAHNLPAVQDDRPQRVPIMSGAMPRAIVPVDFDGAYRIANVVYRAGMAPKSLDSVEKCMVAIMHGMEVGLTPMNALQVIAVINGRPTIYGDGAIGLVQASGLLDDIEETYVGTWGEDSYKAVCRVKRKGRSRWVEGEFSVDDAKTAGLWTKRGRSGEPTPWQTYPKRMLKFRARWALRDAFADVLKGLHLREEVEDLLRLQEPTPAEQPKPRRAPPPPEEKPAEEPKPAEAKSEVVEAKVEDAKQAEITRISGDVLGDNLDIPDYLDRRRAPPPPQEQTVDDIQVWLESLENAFSACEDATSLAEEQMRLMLPMKGKVSEEVWKKAHTMVLTHLKRTQQE